MDKTRPSAEVRDEHLRSELSICSFSLGNKQNFFFLLTAIWVLFSAIVHFVLSAEAKLSDGVKPWEIDLDAEGPRVGTLASFPDNLSLERSANDGRARLLGPDCLERTDSDGFSAVWTFASLGCSMLDDKASASLELLFGPGGEGLILREASWLRDGFCAKDVLLGLLSLSAASPKPYLSNVANCKSERARVPWLFRNEYIISNRTGKLERFCSAG